MPITEKSREALIWENAVLRNELSEMRGQSIHAQQADNDFCTTLVREVPEYLYSIEFTNGEISTIFHSPQCEEITGYYPGDYKVNPNLWMEMIHEKDRDRVREFLQGMREPLNCKSIEHRIIHKDGSMRWVLNMTTVHRDTDGSRLRQSGFIIDVSGRREDDERTQEILDETRRNSFTDDLTQLYNRRAFRILSEQQVLVAERINHPVLLFYIDVDNFKQVNDAFGHTIGDKLLCDLALILKSTFRESDIIARMGGDEYAILSMETGPDSGELLTERLHENIAIKNRTENNGYNLSVSIGTARYNLNQCDSVVNLLDRADKNMYAQKKAKTKSENVVFS